jgi:hypothetical protein
MIGLPLGALLSGVSSGHGLTPVELLEVKVQDSFFKVSY